MQLPTAIPFGDSAGKDIASDGEVATNVKVTRTIHYGGVNVFICAAQGTQTDPVVVAERRVNPHRTHRVSILNEHGLAGDVGGSFTRATLNSRQRLDCVLFSAAFPLAAHQRPNSCASQVQFRPERTITPAPMEEGAWVRRLPAVETLGTPYLYRPQILFDKRTGKSCHFVRHERTHNPITPIRMKKYNVGIVGYGWAATAHIAAINATGRAQVTAVCSSRKLSPA